MITVQKLSWIFSGFSLVVLTSTPLWACAVCFGAPGSPMNRGFFWGIVLLLSLPFFLVSLLAGLILYHTRKKKSLTVS